MMGEASYDATNITREKSVKTVMGLCNRLVEA